MKSKTKYIYDESTDYIDSSSLFREDGSIKILTKGDNNSVDDRGLYAPGQLWLQKKDIVGRARGYISNLIIFKF